MALIMVSRRASPTRWSRTCLVRKDVIYNIPCFLLGLQSATPFEHLPSIEIVKAAKELDDIITRTEPLLPEVLLVTTKDIPRRII
jgi:hypothetical protein